MPDAITIQPMTVPEFGKDTEGWERMSILAEPRLSEMAENYRAIGFEVEVRDIQRNEGICTICFEADNAIGQTFGTLFIRRPTA